MVQVLAFELDDAADVTGEVAVGKMPLRLDVFIFRRRRRLPARAGRDMPVLASLLSRFTLIQYKGPNDLLEQGDLAQFEGLALLWFAQQRRPPSSNEVTLLVIAPRVTQVLRQDCRRLGYALRQRRTGVCQIQQAAFATYILESDMLAGDDPVLALFSPATLDPRRHIIQRLEASGHGHLLHFVMQQVQQFRQMGEHVMKTQFKDLKDLDRFEAEVLAAIPVEKRLRGVPTEERLRGVPTEERLRGVPTEERLRGVPTEERLRGVPAEERLRGVPAEEVVRALLADERCQELSREEVATLQTLLARVRPPARSRKRTKSR
jgi:hypothetical protein